MTVFAVISNGGVHIQTYLDVWVSACKLTCFSKYLETCVIESTLFAKLMDPRKWKDYTWKMWSIGFEWVSLNKRLLTEAVFWNALFVSLGGK